MNQWETMDLYGYNFPNAVLISINTFRSNSVTH